MSVGQEWNEFSRIKEASDLDIQCAAFLLSIMRHVRSLLDDEEIV